MPAVRELLRPPSHRGPLIAAGAVLLTLGLGLVELRLGESIASGVQLLFLAVASALLLGLGLQARNEEGRPPAYKSVLLVCGLLVLAAALLRLGQAVGADVRQFPAGMLVWTGAILALGSAWVAVRSGSAICALIAAVAAGGTVLEAVRWIFHPGSFTPSRWLLLVFAVVLVLLALWLRGSRPRHAELLIDVAALAILAIALQALLGSIVASLFPFAGGPAAPLPGVWELIVLAAGCGLLAYGAIDGAPGPAWLGTVNLLAFLAVTTLGHDSLLWWPLVLLLGGLGVIAAGLRPRAPLPPEPDGYRTGEQPLASRTEGDDVVLRVRDDRPASS